MLVLPGIWFLTRQMEGTQPVISVTIPSLYIGAPRQYAGTVTDTGRGVRRIWAALLQEGNETVLMDRVFPAGDLLQKSAAAEVAYTIDIDPKKMGLKDGEATLRLAAWDHSWRDWGKGNRAYAEKKLTVDTEPPVLDVLSRHHNISPGGAGMVVYRVSEKDARDGVYVGEHFFPGHSGYFEDASIHLAFIALDHTQGQGTEIHVSATDPAGNEARAGLNYYIKHKTFKKDRIPLSDSFLKWKMPDFNVGAEAATDIEKFLIVNRDLRKQNTKTLKTVGETSENTLFWEGSFLRLPRAAPRAGFADYRSYLYNGKVVDHQYHMGVDLASLAKSEIPAGNRGKVAFVGEIGIYGRTVVLDHGFGLFSIYSHMSRVDVQTGEMVEKGHVLGLTGTTGLAGGDHLHYAMMVHTVFVNPIEWWDESWIRNNITNKLNMF